MSGKLSLSIPTDTPLCIDPTGEALAPDAAPQASAGDTFTIWLPQPYGADAYGTSEFGD